MKLIHISDWQPGMTQWSLGLDSGETQARFRESYLNATDCIGKSVTSRGAKFVVVVGDVFDSNALPDKVFLRVLERVAELPVPVYLLPDNHDTFDVSSIFRRSALESLGDRRAYVIQDSGPISIRDEVKLIGVPVYGKYSTDDIVMEIAAELGPTDRIWVMVAHGQIEGFGVDAGTIIDLTSLGQTIDRGVLHCVALGDSHSTSRPDHIDRIYFSGTHETTVYDDRERDLGNALVAEITKSDLVKGSVTVVSHRVGQWAFYAIDMDITGTEDLDESFAELDGVEVKTDTAVKYSLRGIVILSELTTSENQLEQYQQPLAAFYRQESGSDLTVVPPRGDVSNLNLTDYPLITTEKLTILSKGRTESGSPLSESEATTAADALRLLARLAGEKG